MIDTLAIYEKLKDKIDPATADDTADLAGDGQLAEDDAATY